MKSIDVAVFGHAGYAGQELVKILDNHPEVGQIVPVGRDSIEDLDGIGAAFLALPSGESSKVAGQLVRAGSTVIDLSGDFRFETPQEYERWYHQQHLAPELLPAPYGLPEFNHAEIVGAKLVANPGCYPTATLLGLVPLIDNELLSPYGSIVVDAVSGVSGMGKSNKEEADRIVSSGDSYTYKAGRVHQHVGEIEQFLSGWEIFFSPSVGPFFRGMLVRTTLQLDNRVSPDRAQSVLQEAYQQEPFVEVLPSGETPSVESTAGTDTCVIGLVAAGATLQIVSSLDNLRKGAASQAVQGFNVALGFDETSGLTSKL